MTAPRPDYSPAMLAVFLRARVRHAHGERPARCGYQVTVRREKARLKKLAKLTHHDLDMAWMGRLQGAAKRAALWAVFGHFPGDHGITLTDDGGQHG